MSNRQSLKLQTLLALVGFGLCGIPAMAHSAEPVHSVYSGQIIGAPYFNTAGSRTTFTNSSGGGLWLNQGGTIPGVESNSNNCGTVNLVGSSNVVRLDGQIDVSALQAHGTSYVANGGKVFVDSPSLFQSQHGTLVAHGVKPGPVLYAVAPDKVAAMASTANTHVSVPNTSGFMTASQGNNGLTAFTGGDTHLVSANPFVLDRAGKVAGLVDANVIAVEGAGVNRELLMVADAVETQDGVVKIVYAGRAVQLATLANALPSP